VSGVTLSCDALPAPRSAGEHRTGPNL
jgi:hypothetical protein